MTSLAVLVAAKPTSEHLLAYQTASTKVLQYAYAITNTVPPILEEPPSNYYDEFTKKFAPAKAHCLEWTGAIFPKMLALPKIIVDNADLFDLRGDYVKQYLDILIVDPQNAKAKEGLAKSLESMRQSIKLQTDAIDGLIESIDGFSAQVSVDAQALGDLADQALDAVITDKKRIEEMKGAITDLHREIERLNTGVLIGSIGTGASALFGLVGVWVCIIPGGQVIGAFMIILGVLGFVGSITGTVLASKRIQADRELIAKTEKTIENVNKDVIVLQAVSAQFQGLNNANNEARDALKTVRQMWVDLDDELKVVQHDLATVGNDTTSADYSQAKTDMEAAAKSWQEVVEFATALTGIDYKWQDKDGNWHSVTENRPGADNGKVDVLPKETVA